MVTKERESRPLLNVTPESEFEVQGVNVEGIGGDDEEGTSQSSTQTQKVGKEIQMIKERKGDFICNIKGDFICNIEVTFAKNLQYKSVYIQNFANSSVRLGVVSFSLLNITPKYKTDRYKTDIDRGLSFILLNKQTQTVAR